jgi:predicted PurR-regulated permease PerM
VTDTQTYKRLLFWLFIGLLFFVFVYLIRSVLLPFVLGAAIAYFLDPPADKLQSLGLSRTAATSSLTGLFFVLLIVALAIIVPTLASQLSGLISDIPAYVNALETSYAPTVIDYVGTLPEGASEKLREAASGLSGTVLGVVAGAAGNVFSSGMALMNLLSLVLITPVVAFYLLRDWDRITQHIDNLLPRAHANTIREQLHLIDQTLAGFIRGQINVCLLLGAFYAIGLSLVGLKFGALIGLATGFLVILPYVGLIFGMGVGLAVAFFQFDDMSYVGMVLAVFVVGQIIEGNFVTPKLVGEKVGLHPVWIIFGMLAGAALFGFVGILIAVPATAVLGVLIRFATARYLESGYYHGRTGSKKA